MGPTMMRRPAQVVVRSYSGSAHALLILRSDMLRLYLAPSPLAQVKSSRYLCPETKKELAKENINPESIGISFI
jgi:hypothetical protein